MYDFPLLIDKPYFLFGHRLGSRIGFELLLRGQYLTLRIHKHFIASGCCGG